MAESQPWIVLHLPPHLGRGRTESPEMVAVRYWPWIHKPLRQGGGGHTFYVLISMIIAKHNTVNYLVVGAMEAVQSCLQSNGTREYTNK